MRRCAVATLAALAMPGAEVAAAGQVRGELLATVRVVGSCAATLTGDTVTQHCAAETFTVIREERLELESVPTMLGPAPTAQTSSPGPDGPTYVTLVY